MSSYDHLALLHVTEEDEVALHNPNRFQRVVREMTNPAGQFPRVVHLFGRKSKDLALRELFPHNNTRRTRHNAVTKLQADVASLNSDSPLLFVDSDPFSTNLPSQNFHETTTYPTTWSRSSEYSAQDILYARLFFPFTDVICIFADDFPSLDDVARRLITWLKIGSGSSLPHMLRPRVLVVVPECGPSATSDVLQIDNFQFIIREQTLATLEENFSSIQIFPLASDHLSPMARHRRLKEAINTQTEELQGLRHQQGFMFSAVHLEAFFGLAVQHTAHTIVEPFDFIKASRIGNEISEDYSDHLLTFLKLGERYKLPYDTVTSFIASSILMDAYPPGMHRFNPTAVFQRLYEHYCTQALSAASNSAHFVEHQCNNIARHLDALTPGLEFGYDSSAQLHSDNLRSQSPRWALITTNRTCLFCLRRTPEHPMGCGHSICDTCVRIFGRAVPSLEHHFIVNRCILCRTQGSAVIRLKPPTAGVRILSVDGGGTRGVVPLEFLKLLQASMPSCPIHSLFDIAFGTSSGGLIVLALGVLQMDVFKCSKMFDKLAKQCFGVRPQSDGTFFARLKKAVRCLASDGAYDVNMLESSLKDTFGVGRRLFDKPGNGPSGMKVAVTATSISNASSFLFANYNGSGFRNGYTHLRSEKTDDEPLVWQAARATSAAPSLFPPIYLPAFGSFQDGGVGRHNNPVNLAQWESGHIWPADADPALVLSLGTGKEKSLKSSHAPYYRHLLNDSFPYRIYKSYLSFLDGELSWESFKNRNKKSKSDLFRFNIVLPDRAVIDDLAGMDGLRNEVHLQPQGPQALPGTSYALLISAFFFVLESPPFYEVGFYRCQGSLRCRGDSHAVLKDLKNLNVSELDLVTDTEFLGSFGLESDICPQCHLYKKDVIFYVRHPTDVVTIYVQSMDNKRRKVGGFPQTIARIQEQQSLGSAFGSADHGTPGAFSCRSCKFRRSARASRKRELIEAPVPTTKKPRLKVHTGKV